MQVCLPLLLVRLTHTYIEVSSATESPPLDARRAAVGSASPDVSGVVLKVLIVEDNPSIRRLLQKTVSEFATEVQDCSNGEQALVRYHSMHPDVVLMDIRMPVLDGLETTRRITASDPSARIVMVTDYDDGDLRNAAAEAGACGYILKENMAEIPKRLALILAGSS